MMKYLYYYDSPIGKLSIIEENSFITSISFGIVQADSILATILKTDIINKAIIQLEEYFAGKRKEFNIPINPIGTEFQKRVWKELLNIPYGETRSYKEIAEKADNPKAARAVGMANNKNPIPIIIPCHRVVGANKKLIGYAGGLDIKERLLELER